MTSPLQWFREQSLGVQLLVTAMVCDPLGLALGVLLHVRAGVDLYTGLVMGLVVASMPMTALVLSQSLTES